MRRAPHGMPRALLWLATALLYVAAPVAGQDAAADAGVMGDSDLLPWYARECARNACLQSP
jgi:hypothetical protein